VGLGVLADNKPLVVVVATAVGTLLNFHAYLFFAIQGCNYLIKNTVKTVIF